jgi:hypothetical protein
MVEREAPVPAMPGQFQLRLCPGSREARNAAGILYPFARFSGKVSMNHNRLWRGITSGLWAAGCHIVNGLMAMGLSVMSTPELREAGIYPRRLPGTARHAPAAPDGEAATPLAHLPRKERQAWLALERELRYQDDKRS